MTQSKFSCKQFVKALRREYPWWNGDEIFTHTERDAGLQPEAVTLPLVTMIFMLTT
jgi:hypothetical protein